MPALSTGIVVIDIKAIKVATTIATANNANNIAITQDGTLGFVTTSSGGQPVTVIDIKNRKVAKTIPVEMSLSSLAITPNGHFVLAGTDDDNKIVLIDIEEQAVSHVIDTAGNFIQAIAITPDSDLALVAFSQADFNMVQVLQLEYKVISS